MPESLKPEEVQSQTDPSVAKQFDDETPKAEQFEDLYGIADKLKVSLLGTYRPGVGPVHRAMAVGRRDGPDFLYLANAHSQKFKDLSENKECSVTFQDSSTENWISVTGTVTTTDNSDPRIKVRAPASAAPVGSVLTCRRRRSTAPVSRRGSATSATASTTARTRTRG